MQIELCLSVKFQQWRDISQVFYFACSNSLQECEAVTLKITQTLVSFRFQARVS